MRRALMNLECPTRSLVRSISFKEHRGLVVRVTVVVQLTVIRDPGTSPMVMITTGVSDQKKET